MAEPGPAKVLSWARFLVLGAPEHTLAVGGSESRVPRQNQEAWGRWHRSSSLY